VARGSPGKEKPKAGPFEKPSAKGCGTQGLLYASTCLPPADDLRLFLSVGAIHNDGIMLERLTVYQVNNAES